MKKISLLKKIGMGIASISASVPLVLTATSCSKGSNITTTYISFNRMRDERSLVNMRKSHYSNDTVLLGSDKFSNGNYILFVGSNTFSLTKGFFAAESTYSKDISDWFNNHLTDSVWYSDVIHYPAKLLSDPEFKSFGFVTFLDNFDFKFYDKNGHQYFICRDATKYYDIIENVNPFQKWKKEWIVQTKIFMKNVYDYDWDDEAVSEGDYIRQDKQAKAYRSFCQRGLEYFPTNETRTKSFVTDDSDGSLMVIYKGGKLQEIVTIPADKNNKNEEERLKDKDTATLMGAINKYFAHIEDDPE